MAAVRPSPYTSEGIAAVVTVGARHADVRKAHGTAHEVWGYQVHRVIAAKLDLQVAIPP